MLECAIALKFQYSNRKLGTVTNIEFMALARDGDFTRVMISRNQNSCMTVSAVLICDNEAFGLTAYNHLRDSTGNILEFKDVMAAEKTIRACGYSGQISPTDYGKNVIKAHPAFQ